MTVELIFFFSFPELLENKCFKKHQLVVDSPTYCNWSQLSCWSAVNNVVANACHEEFFCSMCECRGSVIGYAEFVSLEGEEGNFICFS